MKSIFFISTLIALLCSQTIRINAQETATTDSTGLPGDHFSLQGALQMFQKAASPEDFEKLINSQDNHVNNLDLNEDGETDYIRVIGRSEGTSHVFVLQAIVSETENQDIAVIELEKTADEYAIIQILGDEDIYGHQIIIEPTDDTASDAVEPAKKGGPNPWYHHADIGIVINVLGWPSVRYVYGPAYRPWVSSVRWRSYPVWWRPWRPLGWRAFHPFHIRHHRGFGVVHTHRVVHAHRIYTPHRTVSKTVKVRHSHSVNKYRVTRTKTTITGPKGKVKTTRTTTKIKRR
jgi:hypothetical protein